MTTPQRDPADFTEDEKATGWPDCQGGWRRIVPDAAPAAAPAAPAPDADGPTMDDAIAAGDGTLHGAIDYWQAKCEQQARELAVERYAHHLAQTELETERDRAERAESALSAARAAIAAADAMARAYVDYWRGQEEIPLTPDTAKKYSAARAAMGEK